MKREEDLAYSLLGIFDISIPVIYGEGKENAFRRLNREWKYRLDELSQATSNYAKRLWEAHESQCAISLKSRFRPRRNGLASLCHFICHVLLASSDKPYHVITSAGRTSSLLPKILDSQDPFTLPNHSLMAWKARAELKI